MKKYSVIVVVLFLFTACQQKISSADIAKINGYWEIEKVTFDKGKDKNYPINESYDYFEIKNNRGIRKKVMPQLDGTFLVNDTFETLSVQYLEDKVFLEYATPYLKWSEEVISLSPEELVLSSQEKTQYHYKKATPINLLQHGKTTK